MNQDRDLSQKEWAILHRLLSVDLPGKDQLIKQTSKLRAIDAHDGDNYGSIYLLTKVRELADVKQRVPVEAVAHDEDGVPITVLLHVIDGLLNELEFFREDGEPIKRWPNVDEFEVKVNIE